MAKTNFTKVEQALEEGLRKMAISKLSDLADIAAGIGSSAGGENKKITATKRDLIKKIRLNLARLEKKDANIYQKLKVDKSRLEETFSDLKNLSDAEWKGLDDLKKTTDSLITEAFPPESDTSRIEKGRTLHKTKRFNVNDKWLPL